MESQDRRKNSPSGSEGHGIHVCHKCGWPFPNARPSAKHRKAHKRVCGTIEGYKAHLGGSDDEHLSDNDSKTLSNGLETVEKAAEMAVSSRSFSGVESGSNRSSRSEEDVFSDAVTDFGDALGVSDSDDVREPAKQQVISVDDRVSKGIADTGGSDTQYYMSNTTMSSSFSSGLDASEEESSVRENTLQCSKTSSVLNSEEEGSLKGVLFEKSEDIATVPTENAGIASETVFVPPKVNGDSLELLPEDAAMEVIGKESVVFGENSDIFPKDGFDAQMNSLDNSSEAMNVKAGGLPLGEHSKVLPEKLPAVATLDPAQEADFLGLSEDSVIQGTLAGPNESDNKHSKEISSEAQEDNSDDEVFVEMNSEKNDTHATDADISEPSNVVVYLDKDVNEVGQGKVVTEEQNPMVFADKDINEVGQGKVVTEEQNSLVFADTNLQRVLDYSDIHTHSISSVKPDHNGSEHDNEDAEFSDALEAMNVKAGGLPLREHSKVLPEKLPAVATLDPAQEADFLGLNEDSVIQGTLAGPNESDNKHSKEIISEALHQEDNSDDDVFVEMNSEKNDTHATDADISEPSNVVVYLDKDVNEVGQGKVVTEEQNPLVFADKDINEVGQGKVVTEEQNPLVFADTNLQRVMDDSDIHTHSISSVKPDHNGSEHDNEDAEFSDALEADGPKVAEEELPQTNETPFISDICITAEKNLLGGGNGDDHDGRSTKVEKLSEATPSIPEFEDSGDDKAEVERKYGNVLEAATSDSSKVSLLQCDVETKKLPDSEVADKDLGSPSEQMLIGESASAVVASAISSVDDNVCVAEPTHIDENCLQKTSDSIDVSLTKKVKDNDVQLEKIEISGAKDLENVGDRMSGKECIRKVDIGLISDNDDDNDFTQNATNGFNTGEDAEAVLAVEDCSAKERDGISSSLTDKDRKLIKQEDIVSELDIQADLISQTDSLEGNWGSVSVLSTLSDAQAATDTRSQPSQESVKGEKANLQPKSNNGKSDIFQPPSYMSLVEQKADGIDQNEGAPEAQTSQKPQEHGAGFPSLAPMANESSGRKRNEGIVAKVTNWSTGKQNMPLKSYLGESSPSAKDNPPPPISQESKNTVMGTKEAVDEAARELGKEWNSPVRYPANIKREKGKDRSRPLWATFICCSSVQTS